MKTNFRKSPAAEMILLGVFVFALSSLRHSAQSTPDIVWTTNITTYDGVLSVAFSQDSTRLASGSEDLVARIWDVPGGSLIRQLSTADLVQAVAFSHDGAYLATGGGGKTATWRLSDGYRVWAGGPEDTSFSLAFSPDDNVLGISRSDGINMRYALSGLGIPFNGPDCNVYQIVFSPNGSLLASANASQVASLWRMPEGTLERDLSGHSNEVFSVDFSPDGTQLLSSSSDGTARLWRVADGELLRIYDGAGGSVIKFTVDGKAFLSLKAGLIRFWRVADNRLLQTYSTFGETDSKASCLAVTPNGNYFAYGTDSLWSTPGVLVLARMPLWISEVTRAEEQATLNWQGGSGYYQLQQTTNLTSGPWQNVGAPSTNTTFTTVPGASNVFYRVQNVSPGTGVPVR